MANGTDSGGNFVTVSHHRTGMKREFQFALKAQSEICGSLSRTRSRRNSDNVVSVSPRNKRRKRCEVKKEKQNEEEKPGEDVHEHMSEEEGFEVKRKKQNEDERSGEEEEAKSDVVDDAVGGAKMDCSDKMEVPEAVQSDLNCVDDVANDQKRKSEKENVEMNLKEALEGVEEGMGESDQVEVQKFETTNEVVDTKELQNDECDGVSMAVEGVKCEKKGQPGGDEPKNAGDDPTLMNGVVQRPLRRFTRSMLQSNTQKSATENGVKEENANESLNGSAHGVMKQNTVTKRKSVMRRFSTRLKDFLDSGILEGMAVTYFRSSKVRGSGGLQGVIKGSGGLQGVIKGSGILCFCNDCKGIDVVTPAVFELHAGSSNKRPPEYIYLENGKTLRDVMNACKDSPLDILEEAVTMASGSSAMKSSFCLNCKDPIGKADARKSMLLCNLCVGFRESQAACADMGTTSEGSLEPKSVQHSPESSSAQKSAEPNSIEQCLEPVSIELSPDQNSVIKDPDSVQKSSHSALKLSSSKKSQGRITRKDLGMHKLVFEEGGLDDGTEVAYFVRGQKLLVGYKKGTGILCCCCDTQVSPSQFEVHAGWASRRKPFQHIYTSNGVSLHEWSIYLARFRKRSTKENDELCGICADGGEVLHCATCPRSFHADCVSLPRLPSGPWSCRYCKNNFLKERFVEHNANAIAAGRVEGVDPIMEINNRCIRIVQTLDIELGGCVLCRGRDFCKSGFGLRTVMLCDQCEREYHVGCLRDHGMEDLKELPKGKWLCSPECKRINWEMQKLIDHGEEKLPDSVLESIKKKHEKCGSESVANVDIRWRVLRGRKVDSSDGTRALLSKAVSIFHDRFDPIIDSATQLDLIPAMAYGRSHKGQDYHGMYCAILTANDEVISAGIFRIFGQELAELPLVATTKECQGQGYFQCLYSCIEKLLSHLHVRKLVLPSAAEAKMIWTNKFCFGVMSAEEAEKCRNVYPLMFFEGTTMLEKPVPEHRVLRKSSISSGD